MPDAALQFEEIYTPAHRRRVFTLCLKILGNREDAEDATQDTFIEVHRAALAGFRGESSVITWLCGIAKRRAFRHLRDYRAPAEFVSLEEPAGDVGTVADTLPSPAMSLEFASETSQAFARLEPELRLPLELTAEGYNSAQIGAALSIPPSTVRDRLSRARRQIRGDVA